MREGACAAAIALAFVLGGCAGRSDVRSAGCSGVPGELVNPNAADSPAATHGPGVAAPAPLRIAATGGTPFRHARVLSSLPMLYAYDDAGRYAMDLVHVDDAIRDPLLEQAAQHAFWGEVSGGSYYSIPWFSTCDQQNLLGGDFVFRAPPRGVLLVQYRLHDCAACDRIDAAIERAIAAHPDVAYRWIQFDLGSAQATSAWCFDDFSFSLRENWQDTPVTEGYTCHR
jgi:hypothetical protein